MGQAGRCLSDNRPNIRRVQQRDEQGCGIACVAMLSGKTYAETKRFFVDRIFVRQKKAYARHYQLCRALKIIGFKVEKRKFHRWRSIGTNAIIPIRRRQDGGWHWVLFVHGNTASYILDPEHGKIGRRFDFRGLKSNGFYIAILGT